MGLEGWRTFILVVLGLIGFIILLAVGTIPEVLSVVEYTTAVGILIGIYAGKSVGQTMATKNTKTLK